MFKANLHGLVSVVLNTKGLHIPFIKLIEFNCARVVCVDRCDDFFRGSQIRIAE